jgi:hypothetical protein
VIFLNLGAQESADFMTIRYRLIIEGDYNVSKDVRDLQKLLDDIPDRDLFDHRGPRGQIVKREVVEIYPEGL